MLKCRHCLQNVVNLCIEVLCSHSSVKMIQIQFQIKFKIVVDSNFRMLTLVLENVCIIYEYKCDFIIDVCFIYIPSSSNCRIR